jgi:hypothetical protein
LESKQTLDISPDWPHIRLYFRYFLCHCRRLPLHKSPVPRLKVFRFLLAHAENGGITGSATANRVIGIDTGVYSFSGNCAEDGTGPG